MGWITSDKRMEESDFLLAVGKCLFLCQHFESTCKDIVMWLHLSKAIHEGQFRFLSAEHEHYVDRLVSLFLGSSIQQLQHTFHGRFTEEDFTVQKAAKDSRNFICHECVLDLVYAPFGPMYRFAWDVDLHREHVLALAKGDYLVSRWSYEFHEKESGAFVCQESYVADLERWVFGNG